MEKKYSDDMNECLAKYMLQLKRESKIQIATSKSAMDSLRHNVSIYFYDK